MVKCSHLFYPSIVRRLDGLPVEGTFLAADWGRSQQGAFPVQDIDDYHRNHACKYDALVSFTMEIICS